MTQLLSDLARLYMIKGDLDRAETLILLAKHELGRSPNLQKIRPAGFDGTHSNILLAQGKYAQALNLLLPHYEELKKMTISPFKIMARHSIRFDLGIAYYVKGDLHNALKLMNEELKALRGPLAKIGRIMGINKESLALGNAGLSIFYRIANDYESAKFILAKAMTLAQECKSLWPEQEALTQYGITLYEEGNLDAAAQFLTLASRIGAITGCNFSLFQSLSGLAAVELARNHPEKAVQYCEHLEKINAGKSFPWIDQFALMIKAEAFLTKGQTESAIEVYDMLSVQVGGLSYLGWRIYNGKGNAYKAMGKVNEALQSYRMAVESIEQIREALPGKNMRINFTSNKMDAYDNLIDLLYELEQPEAAYNYMERARARLFLDLLGNRRLAVTRKNGGDALAKVYDSQIDLIAANSLEEGLTLVETNQVLSVDPTLLHERLRDKSQHYSNLLNDLASRDAELASLVSVNPVSYSDIQAALDQDSCILVYYLGQKKAYGILHKRTGLSMKQLPAEAFQIRRLAIDLNRRLASPGDAAQAAQQLETLYTILLEPFRPLLPERGHLIILPHNQLHYVPFEALIDPTNGRYLLESELCITYQPSLSVMTYCRKKPSAPNHECLILGNPARKDFPPLPGAGAEAQAVATITNSANLFLGKDAKESAVKAKAPDCGLHLFSCHGELKPEDPLQSRLLLADGNGEDGDLTVMEIFDLNLKSNLVVLSACQSSLAAHFEGSTDLAQTSGNANDRGISLVKPATSEKSKLYERIQYRNASAIPGDELVGLNRAFMFAGAKSVVGSLWNVNDIASATLMERFFTLAKTKPKAIALKEAKLSIMNDSQTAAPFFWAPFVLNGDWEL